MIVVPVAQDQGIGPRRIDFDRLVIAEQGRPGQGEVEQDLFPLIPSERFQMVGQPVL
jgi:hypothetical protein